MNTPSYALLHARGVRLKELIKLVSKWGHDRNIIQGSTAIKQLDKTSEEFNELQRAVAIYQRQEKYSDEWYEAQREVKDGLGDILVTLILAAEILEVDLETALGAAYDEIKDRKGRLVGGKFIKEADL